MDSIIRNPLDTNSRLIQNFEYILKVKKVNFTIQAALRKDSVVALRFNFYHPFNFREHKKYQRILVRRVVQDFSSYPLNSVFLGRLIYTGDLSIRATYPVLKANWDRRSYPDLKQILDTGYIVETYSEFFEEFDCKVKGVSFEKAFLVNIEDVETYSTITVSKDSLPSYALDALMWLNLE